MATKKQEHTTSDFYCTKCGKKGIPIIRRAGQQREVGHLKSLFCLNCGKEQNHAEVRSFGSYTYKDFLLEYNNGNFDENGKRILPYGIFKNALIKKEMSDN